MYLSGNSVALPLYIDSVACLSLLLVNWHRNDTGWRSNRYFVKVVNDQIIATYIISARLFLLSLAT